MSWTQWLMVSSEEFASHANSENSGGSSSFGWSFDGQILIFSAFLKPFSFQMDDPLIPNQVSSNWWFQRPVGAELSVSRFGSCFWGTPKTLDGSGWFYTGKSYLQKYGCCGTAIFKGKPPIRIESYGRIPVSFHPNYDLGGGFKHGWIIVHFIY